MKWVEFLEQKLEQSIEESEKKWLQGAIDDKHKGYCTPMSKSTCTPHRKALAKRFKKGGDLHEGQF